MTPQPPPLLLLMAVLIAESVMARELGGIDYPERSSVKVFGGSVGDPDVQANEGLDERETGNMRISNGLTDLVPADPTRDVNGRKWASSEDSWHTRAELMGACGMGPCQTMAAEHCWGNPVVSDPIDWTSKPDGSHHNVCCHFGEPAEWAGESAVEGHKTTARDDDLNDATFFAKHVEACLERAARNGKAVTAAGWCVGGDSTDAGMTAQDRCELHGGEVVWSYHSGRLYAGAVPGGEGPCLTLDGARRRFDLWEAKKRNSPTPTPTPGILSASQEAAALNEQIGRILGLLANLDLSTMDPAVAAAYLAALHKLNAAQREFVETVMRLFPDLLAGLGKPPPPKPGSLDGGSADDFNTPQ